MRTRGSGDIIVTLSHLPSQVLVVGVANIETLGGEGIGLDFNIGSGHLVDETGLANIGET